MSGPQRTDRFPTLAERGLGAGGVALLCLGLAALLGPRTAEVLPREVAPRSAEPTEAPALAAPDPGAAAALHAGTRRARGPGPAEDAPAAEAAEAPEPGAKVHTEFLVRHAGEGVAGARIRVRRTGDAPAPVGTAISGADGLVGYVVLGGRGGSIRLLLGPGPHPEDAREEFDREVGDPERTSDVVATTDARGRATAALPSGVYDVLAWRGEGASAWIGHATAVIHDGEGLTVLVETERAVRISGQVRDERGFPAAGVAVQAWAASDARASRASARVRTDADGRFTLVGFGWEPHVVRAYGSIRSFLEGGPSATAPAPAADWEGATAIVPVEDLSRVDLVVRGVEATCLELVGRVVTGYGIRTFDGTPASPGVWIASGEWGTDLPARPTPTYVVVDQGTGCPWYVLRLRGAAPVVAGRSPGGLRTVRLEPGRRVRGVVSSSHAVRAFARCANGDRVEFAVATPVEGGAFDVGDAPTSAFDLAAFDGDRRLGDWVRVPAGLDDVEGLEIPAAPSGEGGG